MKETLIQENEAGQRLDKYLAKRLCQAPKSFLYKMMRKKNITLNKKKSDGHEILAAGDRVQFFLSDETYEKFSKSEAPKTARTNLKILYEDEDILLINKPAGMLSQPDQSKDPSLVEYLTGYLLETGALSEKELETFHPGVCNRLDRNTTGIVCAGKSLYGLQKMSEVFKERRIHKYYLCICFGVIKEPQHLKGYLHKDKKSNQVTVRKEAAEGDSFIETKFRPLGDNGEMTLLEVELLTGKPHQIRAHLASVSHGIVGDSKYLTDRRERELSRQMGLHYQQLHAYRLVFPDIEGRLEKLSGREVQAPLPALFMKTLNKLQLEEYYGRL